MSRKRWAKVGSYRKLLLFRTMLSEWFVEKLGLSVSPKFSYNQRPFQWRLQTFVHVIISLKVWPASYKNIFASFHNWSPEEKVSLLPQTKMVPGVIRCLFRDTLKTFPNKLRLINDSFSDRPEEYSEMEWKNNPHPSIIAIDWIVIP